MNNVIILGAGRSGTSMLAGSISSSGPYNIGGIPHKPNKWNEKGFFETKEINAINDDILKQTKGFQSTEGKWQGWLGTLDTNIKTQCNENMINRMINITKNEPFCIKDPRFSYTLKCWYSAIPLNTKFICILRHPSVVIDSLIKYCSNTPYLNTLKINKNLFEKIWFSIYNYILKNYYSRNMLMIHYNQILYDHGLEKVEKFIGNKINQNFPSTKLCHHETNNMKLQPETIKLYNELCYLSDTRLDLR